MQQDQLFRSVLLAALVYAGTSGAAAAGGESSEVPLGARVSETAQVLVWDRGFDSGACWFLVYDSEQIVDLGCGLAGMHQVYALMPSLDHRWLAVLSAGEGHPLLEVVGLQDLVAGQGYRVVAEINPYPGTVNLDHWTEGALLISSDMPLHDFPLPEGDLSTYMLPDERVFVLDAETWKVHPAQAEPTD